MIRETSAVAVADRAEQELLARFTGHSVFETLESLPQEGFLAILLQRRFISLIFPVVYDLGIDGLTDSMALQLVRQILREEYPGKRGKTPSHREDLVRDLKVLGATTDEILACRPTAATRAVLLDTLELMADATCYASDLKVLTMLRFWGEVVVSVEYGEYWKRMRPHFAAAERKSRFFYEHYSHDGREPLSTASTRSRTHSGQLGETLKGLLDTAEAAEVFAAVESSVLDLRMRFYDQFR